MKLEDLLPEPLVAGTPAGELTEEGARLLDTTGTLQPGITLAPPEGDAGTGMMATNSVRKRTGNVSAGTSPSSPPSCLRASSKALHPGGRPGHHPAGDLAGMSHANNFTSDLNAWVGLFGQFAEAIGQPVDAGTLYGTLFPRGPSPTMWTPTAAACSTTRSAPASSWLACPRAARCSPASPRPA